MGRKMLFGAVVCTGLAVTAALAAEKTGNLVADPSFKQADFAPLAKETTWLWYQIVAPSEAKLDKDKAAVTMTGGKTFLHSAAFDVTAEKKYNISVKAQGKGKIYIECLWWTRYDDDGIGMAKPHRTFAVEATEIGDETKKIAGQDTAPKEAKRAYIRVVVEEGTVTVSAPSVTAAP